MFKKLIITSSFLLTSLLLTSCSFSTDLVFDEYNHYIDEFDNKYEINNESFYKLKEYEPLSYIDFDNNTHYINNFRDLYSSSNNGRTYLNMATIGEQRLLVLPVSFKDSDKSNQKEKQIYIQNAFFGKPDKTIHESVASFYNKSSFGHLKLKGVVDEFLNLPFTSEEALKMGGKTTVSRYITSLALDNYKQNHDDINLYDNDKDGYVDGIFVIYDHEFSNLANNLYWAYVDHMNANETIHIDKAKKINVSEPYASMYGWASIDFMKEKHNYVDAHVFIHETGHIFGLQDYYSDGVYQPLGFMDMMDYNLGDHNIFSKMLLNWTTPYVIKDSTTLTLRPSFETGDCVIIPSINELNHDYGWNKTPYDEMLVLEFYAPEGVNAYDSTLSFNYTNGQNEQKIGRLFSNYGIKLYHVDSRIGYVKNKSLSSYIGLINDVDIKAKLDAYKKDCEKEGLPLRWCLDFPFNNKNASHPYISLIESTESDSLLLGNAADNHSLFKKDMDFGLTTYQDFTFYDNSKLPFGFKVKNITPNEATIEFVKL